jgi:5-methylcytosine-specific restriction endonuclease McrA
VSKIKDRPNCFYCGACVSGNGVGDHFPIPKSCGGTETVPCCESCHDMKDRFDLTLWDVEWISAVINDLPKVSRETRLFLAKAVSVMYHTKKFLTYR